MTQSEIWRFRQNDLNENGVYIYINSIFSLNSKCYFSIFDPQQQTYKQITECKSDSQTSCSDLCSEQHFIRYSQLSNKAQFIKIEESDDEGESTDKIYIIGIPRGKDRYH